MLPASKFVFFVMILNEMHYFYIDECVVVIQGLEYQVKSMYAYFESCLDVFQ